MERSQKENFLIANVIMNADSKGLHEEVQEIIIPFLVENKSIDLKTICKLEVLLDDKLLIIPSDKEWLVINRREKLNQLKIVSGEIIPIVKYIKVDETGTITLENES